MADLVLAARAQFHPALAAVNATLLGYLLTAASDWVKEYCGRTFTASLLAEKHNGTGDDTIFVDELPITSLVDVKILNDDGTTDTCDDLDFRYDAAVGEIKFQPDPTGDWDYFPKGHQNITIDYNAGYATIPQAVQEAVCQVAIAMRAQGSNANNPALASESMGAYSYSLKGGAENTILTPALRATLAMYRVHGRGE